MKLVITFICENRHNVETVSVDLVRWQDISKEDMWNMLSRDCRCSKCGSDKFTIRTRYKD